jgi:hypothetical protein
MDIFYDMPCLTERSASLKGIYIQKKFLKSADKRNISQYLQKLIQYNQDALSFLGVTAYIVNSDLNASLTFRSSNFIGCVPLRASDTGKQIGDFVVSPRYVTKDKYQDYIAILSLLGEQIQPEFMQGLNLTSGKVFRPPMYLEAIRFIHALDDLAKQPWHKFQVIEKNLEQPVGQVNWDKYTKLSHKPERMLLFPQRKNTLTEQHLEYSQIKYVFDLCKHEIQSSNTPTKIKYQINSKIEFLNAKLNKHNSLKTKAIPIKSSDNLRVKLCKLQANKILNIELEACPGWRLDAANIFEKYVQHILMEISKEAGGKLLPNYKLPSQHSNRYFWELKYLEPDALYQKGDLSIFIDAKYKSHLFNLHNISEELKSEHRHDLHQILAYLSFSKHANKYGMLCYPSDKVEHKTLVYKNPIDSTTNKIILVGLPLKVEFYPEIKKLIGKLINELEIQNNNYIHDIRLN